MDQPVPASRLADLVGQEVGISDWRTIGQDRINAFADVTEDHQFIHVDLDKAAQTPFGGTIAHGFLTLSLLAPLAEEAGLRVENTVMAVNYGFDKLRFLAPVRAGKRVRARFELLEVTEKAPGQYLMKQLVTVDIEGEDKPALVAEWLGMAYTN